MSKLTDFRSKSFVEQISILAELEGGDDLHLIPELLELFENPLADDAVDGAVGDTLRAFLLQNEAAAVEGLRSSNQKTRDLCIQVAGRAKFESAAPWLLESLPDINGSETKLAALSALAHINPPGSKDVFIKNISNPDPLVSALCIEAVGRAKAEDAVDILFSYVLDADQGDMFDSCDIRTEKAVRALGDIGGERAIEFLSANIHNKNPTTRQIIMETLSMLGNAALPCLEANLSEGDVDVRILTVNVLGNIKTREAEDLLMAAFHRGEAENSNVRFAIYEALGQVCSLKGLVCLVDGLLESDETLLTAVLTSLDKNLNPAVLAQISTLLRENTGHSDGLTRALIKARATNLFTDLYELDPLLGGKIVDLVAGSKVAETISAFADALDAVGDSTAKAHAEKLRAVEVGKSGKKLLVVDDSKSMLLFYQDLCSELGFDVDTAMNGKEALNKLEAGEQFDIIISDMNMPVMNGIEFVKNVRSNMFIADPPILMATTESEKSQCELAKQVGATDFLSKPIKEAELKEAIDRALK